MSTYIQAVSLIGYIADGLLCYYWLGNGHFKKWESFCASVLLVLAAPLTYHSTMQLMFVNYMPFLLLALIGYDRYLKKGKYGMLTASVFLMILTSFYFAVGGLAALFIYGASEYRVAGQREENSVNVAATGIPACLGSMVKWFWRRFYPALLGCLLSLFYLVPVYFAMSSGRSGHGGLSVKELLVPDIRLHKFLYSGYGMGLTAAVLIIVCVSIFYKRCREKVMAVILLILFLFPVFDWLLNGGLYLRDKAFIPFLPLVCYLGASFFTRIGGRAVQLRQALAGSALAAALIMISLWTNTYVKQERLLLYIDIVVCAAALLISLFCWRRAFCAATIVLMSVLSVGQITVLKEQLVTVDEMKKIENPDIGKAVEKTLSDRFDRTEVRGGYDENKANQNKVWACGQNLTTVYSSISNPYYERFREEVLCLDKPSRNSLMADASDNPIFLRFMGVRYIVGDRAPAGYEVTADAGSVNIYEDKDAAPAAYVTDKVMSEGDFLKLSWPERQLALLRVSVTDEKGLPELESLPKDSGIEKADVTLDQLQVKGGASDGTLSVESYRKSDTYLFLSFEVENHKPSKDVTVTVNGEQNKLSAKNAAYYNGNTTFHYTMLLPEGKTKIPVEYGKGDYEIHNVQAWTGTADAEKTKSLYSEPAALEKKGDGNIFEGTAKSSSGGWLITSIPYDENFRLYVDGRQVETHRVNTAFVGAPLSQGTHELRLVYRAKGRYAGFAGTFLTLVILGADAVRRRRKGHDKV